MPIITKELAQKIVKKLHARPLSTKGRRAHDIMGVEFEGKVVAHFGVRHGSGKDEGHNHIPSSLYLSPHDARRLGQCPLSWKDWIEKLRAKGLIDPAEQ